MAQQDLQLLLRAAMIEALEHQHEYVTLEHLLLAMLQFQETATILRELGADLAQMARELEDYLAKELPAMPATDDYQPLETTAIKRVLDRAIIHVQSSSAEELTAADLLVALFQEQDSFAAYTIASQGITNLDLLQYISHGQSGDYSWEEDDGHPEDDSTPRPGKSPLELYTEDLSAQAAAGKFDPLVGRQEELRRLQQILCRRTRNNPLLLGEPGVGKTALIQGLAQLIATGQVPEPLKNCHIFSLDTGAIIAGSSYRGQMEQRLQAVLQALAEKEHPLLVIDEIHMIMGAGAIGDSNVSISNLLKPALSAGRLQCIGATTNDDFRQHMEKDRAFIRRFQPLNLLPPTVNETIKILQGLKKHYEEFHNVTFTTAALTAAATLSDRYIRERALPDKAIDVLDEAGAANRLAAAGKKVKKLGAAEVEKIVATIARRPALEATTDDRQILHDLAANLQKLIYGQDTAITALVNAVKLSRAGLGPADQPIGSFLFTGPTGVGKTELARQLALALAMDFVRFDMSEYMEKHTVSRLLGAPPGYVGFDQGGLLTEAIRQKPHCVLLLDEIEKAHPDLFNVLLQIMDHATLTDNTGRQADFHQVIIIMTSNAGAREMSQNTIGFGGGQDFSQSQKAIEKLFSPEFRGRLSQIVTFAPLSPAIMGQIVDKYLQELSGQLLEKKVAVTFGPELLAYLAQAGYDPQFGARPLKGLIARTIRQPLAEELLFGRLQNGGKILLNWEDNQLTYSSSSE